MSPKKKLIAKSDFHIPLINIHCTCFSVYSLFILGVIHLLFQSPLMMTNMFWCSMSSLFLVSLPSLVLTSVTADASVSPLYFFLFFFQRCWRGWTCTRLSLTASSRSTTSKATRPSATLSESRPLIHLTLGSALTSKAGNIRARPLQTERAARAS